MVRRVLAVATAVMLIGAGAGCGRASDESIADLEKQRKEVLAWASELANAAETALGASPERAVESYEGVGRSGISDKFTSYQYEVQARFHTDQPDPLTKLSEELSDLEPMIDGVTLAVENGELSATFRTFPEGPGKVSLQVDGHAVEIDDSQIDDWEGYVIGEPVDLE
jgi:hypothetical protein